MTDDISFYDLVPVKPLDLAGSMVQTANLRELHAALEVGRDFSTWVNDKINRYGFVEDVDYVTVSRSPIPGSGNRGAAIEYHGTLDMAKELAMVENNARGRAARRYFIGCERMLNDFAGILGSFGDGMVMRFERMIDEKFKARAANDRAVMLSLIREAFPAMPIPSVPPAGFLRFPDYLAAKGFSLTGRQKSSLSKRVLKFCKARGFDIEDGFGGAYRAGNAYPIYGMDCWWKEEGEVKVISLVKARQAKEAVKNTPLFGIEGGKGKKPDEAA
jgi:phage anti-repressor protein